MSAVNIFDRLRKEYEPVNTYVRTEGSRAQVEALFDLEWDTYNDNPAGDVVYVYFNLDGSERVEASYALYDWHPFVPLSEIVSSPATHLL